MTTLYGICSKFKNFLKIDCKLIVSTLSAEEFENLKFWVEILSDRDAKGTIRIRRSRRTTSDYNKIGCNGEKKLKIWGGHPSRPKNFSKKFFLPLGMIFQGLSNKPLYVSVAKTGR